MKVLVTGDKGLVGKEVCNCLQLAGDEISGFDIVDGHDVLDQKSVFEAVSNCKAIVHLAAVDDETGDEIPSEFEPHSQGTPEHVVAVTVLGTMNILAAAKKSAVNKVIFGLLCASRALYMCALRALENEISI